MDQNDVLVKAASALRELVSELDQAKEDENVRDECLKLAFVMADRGQIDNDSDSIRTKAAELFEKKDDLDMIKKAMEYSQSYDFAVGYVDKEASVKQESAENEFIRMLREG